MKTTILIGLLLVLSISQTPFDDFVARYNKIYPSPEVRASKQATYNDNMAKIAAHNAQNNDYKQGENEFSDLTEQQFAAAFGLKPLNIPPNPNPTKPAHKLRGALPASVDWRTQGKVSSIKNQGTCGSCWAFTATALYESLLMIGGLTPEPDLSQEYVLECTTQNSPGSFVSSCGGGVLEYAIPFILETGIPTEADFPYAAANFGSTVGTPSTAGICTTTALVKQTNLSAVYQGTYADLTSMEVQDLLSYAPVTAAIYANAGFMTYRSGIYTGCPDAATSIANLNHAVLVVGYTVDGDYIIKNSWGTTWGESGYAIVSKNADCGIAHSPRELRGTNPQLTYEAFAKFAVMLVLCFMFFM